MQRAARPAASFILQFSINTKDAEEEEDQAAQSPPVVGQSCWQALRSTIVTFDRAPQAEASYRHGAELVGPDVWYSSAVADSLLMPPLSTLVAVVKPRRRRAIKRTKTKLPKLKRKRKLRKEARGEVTAAEAAKRSSVPAHQELVAPLLTCMAQVRNFPSKNILIKNIEMLF